MANKVIWSPRALKSFDIIVVSIQEMLGEAPAKAFVAKVMHTIDLIAANPTIFRRSEVERDKYLVAVTAKTMLFYKVKPRKREVQLLLFWDGRRNPDTLKY